MKNILYILGGLVFFGVVPHALAQGFVPLAPIPGLTQGATADTAGLANFFNNLYKYLIGLAAALAVIEIIWGGLEISTKDSVSKQSDGKNRITQALFGLVLVLSPVLVFSIINPSILNLSVNLPPLDTKSGAQPTNNVPPVQTQPIGPQTEFYPCSAGNCGAAKSLCESKATVGSVPQSSVVCQRSDGSIDPNGRTDSRLNPFSDYACVAGEMVVISCTYDNTSIVSP